MEIDDWGLPDWRDPTAYGDTDEWNLDRWHWEFLRRREDVRALFLDHADWTYENCKSDPTYDPSRGGDGPTPCEPGFWAMFPPEIETGLKLVGIPNPSISSQPFLRTLFLDHQVRITVSIAETDDALNESHLHQVSLKKNGACVEIDLTLPLVAQLDRAKELLEEAQRKLIDAGLVKLDRGRNPGTWFKYLRVLDGREAGATWKDIGRVVHGERSDNVEQQAKTDHKRAVHLSANWPR